MMGLGFDAMMLFEGLLFVAFWALVIGGTIWTVATFLRSNREPSAARAVIRTPLDVLKARYAQGEITPEQFQEMKSNLDA